jgi:hypothetical protein
MLFCVGCEVGYENEFRKHLSENTDWLCIENWIFIMNNNCQFLLINLYFDLVILGNSGQDSPQMKEQHLKIDPIDIPGIEGIPEIQDSHIIVEHILDLPEIN